MSLQINVPLTTNSGLTVPSGTYVWLAADFGNDFIYRVRVKMIFFKNKSAFDERKARFDPVEIGTDLYQQEFTPQNIGSVTYVDIHNFVRDQLEAIPSIGEGNVVLVE